LLSFYTEVLERVCHVRIGDQGRQQIVIDREDFKTSDGKSLEWSNIATLEITIVTQYLALS
jgi:hypothetical protein